MRDSLLSRFRAAFLGTLLGEAIGIMDRKHPALQPIWGIAPTQIALTQMAADQPSLALKLDQGLDSTRLIMAQTEQLLAQPHLPTELRLFGSTSFSSPIDWVMATLPLALLYHDQPAVLQTVLQITLQTGSQPTETPLTDSTKPLATPLNQAAVAVIGQLISLLLRERLVPQELILQLVQDLELSPDAGLDQPLVQALMQVQAWIERPTSLARVSGWCRHIATATPALLEFLPIISALYGFLSTPDSWRLSLARLVQLPQPNPSSKAAACALAGALSGLYNGLSGLPLAGQVEWPGIETSVSQTHLLQLADRLLAHWSGAAHPEHWLNQPEFANLTAAPRVIRPMRLSE